MISIIIHPFGLRILGLLSFFHLPCSLPTNIEIPNCSSSIFSSDDIPPTNVTHRIIWIHPHPQFFTLQCKWMLNVNEMVAKTFFVQNHNIHTMVVHQFFTKEKKCKLHLKKKLLQTRRTQKRGNENESQKWCTRTPFFKCFFIVVESSPTHFWIAHI